MLFEGRLRLLKMYIGDSKTTNKKCTKEIQLICCEDIKWDYIKCSIKARADRKRVVKFNKDRNIINRKLINIVDNNSTKSIIALNDMV